MSFECLAYDIACEYHQDAIKAKRILQQALGNGASMEEIKEEIIKHAWLDEEELKDLTSSVSHVNLHRSSIVLFPFVSSAFLG